MGEIERSCCQVKNGVATVHHYDIHGWLAPRYSYSLAFA